MSAGFSSSLLLADLDYIAPAQACILPTMNGTFAKQKEQQQQNDDDAGSVKIHQKVDPSDPNLRIAPKETLEKVQITLADCLACSGCVTSAETILITNQSREEVERIVGIKTQQKKAGEAPRNNHDNNNDVSFIVNPLLVSVSDQTIAAAAVEWKLSFEDAFLKINQFCRKTFHADFVVPLDWAQTISSLETGFDFVRRLTESQKSTKNQSSTTTATIVSACPGWVCYCEKTHPTLLPLLSPIMSPQTIAGKYWKEILQTTDNNNNNNDNENIRPIHISVQPCFDRKLEAVRPEFSRHRRRPSPLQDQDAAAVAAEDDKNDFFDSYTDCVLSTKELLDWMNEDNNTEDAPLSSSSSSSSALLSTQQQFVSQALFKFNLLKRYCAADSSSSSSSSALPLRRDHEHSENNNHNNNNNNNNSSATHFPAPSPFSSSSTSTSTVVSSGAYHLVAMCCLALHRGIDDFDLSLVEYTERRGNKNFKIATHPQLTVDDDRHENTTNGDEQAVEKEERDEERKQHQHNNNTKNKKKLLQFAVVYGFQHIQNIVRSFEQQQKQSSSLATNNRNNNNTNAKTRSSRLLAGRRLAKNASSTATEVEVAGSSGSSSACDDFCFIEMFACPSGCTNGGGQLLSKSHLHQQSSSSSSSSTIDPDAQRTRLSNINSVFAENFWKRSILTSSSSSSSSKDSMLLFCPDSFYEKFATREKESGDSASVSTTTTATTMMPVSTKEFLSVEFKDRRKEMEEKMDQGNLVSLKW